MAAVAHAHHLAVECHVLADGQPCRQARILPVFLGRRRQRRCRRARDCLRRAAATAAAAPDHAQPIRLGQVFRGNVVLLGPERE